MSENDEVKLKPIMGIEPGKYLIILYLIIIAVVIFLLLFLPGIIRPGTLFKFDSVPQNSIIYVDGKYIGSTPCEAFISEGKHTFTIKKNYFKGVDGELVSGNRIFGSLFFPKKETLNEKVVLEDVEGFLTGAFKDFAEWGMIDSYFENFQPKPVLGPLLKDLKDSGYADIPELSGFLYSIMPFVHNELLYNDFVDAVFTFEEIRGSAPESLPKDIVESFTELKFFQDSAQFIENIPFWFYSLLTDESRENNLSWYPALQEEYGSFLRDFSNDFPAAQAAVTVNGLRFVMLSGGQFLVGADGASFPYPAAVDDFMVMDREVTNNLYRLFLAERTEWRFENIDKLIEEGLVNQDYLKDFENSEGDKPVNFISWYAAEAFCDWFQTKLPEYLSDYTVKLPDENQWEWAGTTEDEKSGIFNNSSKTGPLSVEGRYPNHSGLYDLKGNLWEWCDNWYAPAAPLITSRNPAYNEAFYSKYSGVEKTVKGGSWANDNDISISSRGSQPPDWCTEFLGFRPILVKE